jgi:hypothetical protein
MHHVTAISDHDHEPTIFSNTLFESMPMQIMHYATAKNMFSNTIDIVGMIRSWEIDIIELAYIYNMHDGNYHGNAHEPVKP